MNKTKKSLFIGLVAVAIVGAGLGYGLQTAPISQYLGQFKQPTGVSRRITTEIKSQEVQVERPGLVAVEFDKETAAVWENLEVKILIDTQDKEIDGFDIILQFDPQDWAVLNPQVNLTETVAFAQYPVNLIDPIAGKVQLSGLTSLENSFTGEMVVGSFLLQPQKAGKLNLEVYFEGAGEGVDTNLAEKGTGEDILGDVINGEIIIE